MAPHLTRDRLNRSRCARNRYHYLFPKSETPSPSTASQSGGGAEFVRRMASPRLIKTHLPLYLLNPKLLDTCKVEQPCPTFTDFLFHLCVHPDRTVIVRIIVPAAVESGHIIHGIYHPAAYIGHFWSKPSFYMIKPPDMSSSSPVISATLRGARGNNCTLRAAQIALIAGVAA